MKKLLLLSIMFCGILNSYCQNIVITQLSATSLTEGINVNVKTISGTGSGYLSNTYTVTGNVIDLSVCYWFNNTLPVLEFDNDFLIPLTATGNYTINVLIILSTSDITCDNYATTDNGSISLDYLSTTSFEKMKDNFTLFPNPTNGKVEYKGNAFQINQMEIFDNVGRLVQRIKNISESSLDLSALNDGLYIVKALTQNGMLTQKLVVKK